MPIHPWMVTMSDGEEQSVNEHPLSVVVPALNAC